MTRDIVKSTVKKSTALLRRENLEQQILDATRARIAGQALLRTLAVGGYTEAESRAAIVSLVERGLLAAIPDAGPT